LWSRGGQQQGTTEKVSVYLWSETDSGFGFALHAWYGVWPSHRWSYDIGPRLKCFLGKFPPSFLGTECRERRGGVIQNNKDTHIHTHLPSHIHRTMRVVHGCACPLSG
ncbi:unnamed protein product, partial [Pylaiella littoralis]